MKRGCNSGKHILITGGADFIGVHLCKRMLDNPHFNPLRHDIISTLNVKVDDIYNLVFTAALLNYQQTPVQTTKTRVQDSINLPMPALSPGYLPG